jgi:hypothetical protein
VFLKDYGEDQGSVIRLVDRRLAGRSKNSKGDSVSEHEDKKIEDEDKDRVRNADVEGHKLVEQVEAEPDVEGHQFGKIEQVDSQLEA